MHKRRTASLLLSFLLFHGTFLIAQKLPLDGNWKYTLKDESSFAAPSLNEADWKERPATGLMLKQAELDGKSEIVWMRKTLVIPASFKSRFTQTGAISLFLGRIYQSDEAWFNGTPIGKTNSSDLKRMYIVDPALIRWDQPNTVALRIRHWGEKAGPETSMPYLDAAPVSTVFELSSSATGVQNREQVSGRPAVYSCTVVNRSAQPSPGHISAFFYDANEKKMGEFQKDVTLSSGSNAISFPYTSPSSFLTIRYVLTVPQYAYTARWNDEYGYNSVAYKPAKPVVADKAAAQFVPAGIDRQVIKGWLGERMDANEQKRLYAVDEKAILAGYINRPGSHPWIGEHVGKFLDAASNTYQYTKDEAIKTQLDRTAQQLIATQLEDGYLGTYSPDSHWTSWDVWSHKYNIIGLLNYYAISGYRPALAAAARAGDLLCKTFGYGSGQLDLIKSGTHVGMAATSVLEPMVDLYRYTGDKKYLDFCYYIVKSFDQQNGPKIVSTLDATGRVDKTANAKAYEMLSNLVGLVKLYRVTGEQQFLQPVLLAWKDIAEKRLYITGTASSFEHFKDDGDLPAGEDAHMGEGCVTTTWVQLSYQLLCISGEMKYVNELERSVYNHLTGAENPQSGCVSYYTPLVGVKPYGCSITCCMSSVPRGISMIPLFANGTTGGKPSFFFYQPGVYSTTAPGNIPVSFTTQTTFPASGDIGIKVAIGKAAAFPVSFRKPYWAKDFTLSVNGEKQAAGGGETVTVNRTWKKDDRISIAFTMPVMVLDGGRSYAGYVALQRGPQVLAFDKSLNRLSAAGISIDPAGLQLQPAPAALSATWIGTQAYQLSAPAGSAEKIILVPYADASQTGGAVTTWLKSAGR